MKVGTIVKHNNDLFPYEYIIELRDDYFVTIIYSFEGDYMITKSEIYLITDTFSI